MGRRAGRVAGPHPGWSGEGAPDMGAEVPKSTPPRFEGPLNHGRFVHNAAPPYHTLFRPFRYHPGAARSPLKPVETASGC